MTVEHIQSHSSQKGKSTLKIQQVGIVGAALAALSLVDTLDSVIFLSKLVSRIADHWHSLMSGFWTFVLKPFGFPEISSIDAVFLTFFSMTILSMFTSMSRSYQTSDENDIAKTSFLIFLGLLILAGIFTIGDITTYDASYAEAGDYGFYKSSIQAYFYDVYISYIQPENWFRAGENAYNARIALLYLFYLILTFLIVIILYLASLLLRLRIDLWRLTARIWLIIGFVTLLVVLNHSAVFVESYLDI